MNASLSGKNALITGSTSGIGRAAALELARLGAHVIVSGRDSIRARAVVDTIRSAGGSADYVTADLRDATSARGLALDALSKADGHIDILVNNAGIFPFGPTDETTANDFDRVYNLNVKVPYFLVAELAPGMAARGDGAIINVTTMVAEYSAPGMALYGSSKAALGLLTKSWAAEFGPSGVRVNAVSPGPTRTEGTDEMGDALADLAAQGPAGRPGEAHEIASAIAFLAGATASWIHGAILPVDGGRIAV